MGWREFFGLEEVKAAEPRLASVRFLVPKDVARKMSGMDYQRTFKCSCMNEFTDKPTQITIRTRTDRDGVGHPSNFVPFPLGHQLYGHSQVPSEALNWNGLLEERGWDSNPVKCPACKASKDLRAYKESRR